MTDIATDSDHPDHVGVDFWRAFRAFETAMFAKIAQDGFDGITQADSDVLVHIAPNGTNMVTIARARGVSKQAIQVQIRSLVDRGYLSLAPDPSDARARIVRHSHQGRAMVRALADAKRALHHQIADKLGEDAMTQMRAALKDSITELETQR